MGLFGFGLVGVVWLDSIVGEVGAIRMGWFGLFGWVSWSTRGWFGLVRVAGLLGRFFLLVGVVGSVGVGYVFVAHDRRFMCCSSCAGYKSSDVRGKYPCTWVYCLPWVLLSVVDLCFR